MVSHDLERGLRDAKHVLYLDEKDQYFAGIAEFRESGIAKSIAQDLLPHKHLREVKRHG